MYTSLALILFAACTPKEELCEPAETAAWSAGTAFEDQTSGWGLDGVTGGRFLAGDLDGDGYPDLVVTEVYSNARDDVDAGTFYHRLLLNRDVGGERTFVDATLESGILTNRDGGTGTSANMWAAADVDGDGDLDLFAGRAYDAGTVDTFGDCSEVLLNAGDATFTFAPQSDICVTGGYPTSGASFTDVDGDGVLDLWVVGFYEEYGTYTTVQDRLYQGHGDGTFTDVTADWDLKLDRTSGQSDSLSETARRPAYGATSCDVNGDALPDLIATNYGRSFNHLWINDGAAFTEIGQSSGFAHDDAEDYSDNLMYACWCGANGGCDPEPTVSCTNSDYASYWTPGYDDQAGRLNGNSFTTVCGDIDNDGDLDLMTTEIAHKWAGDSSDRTQLLLNDGDGATFTRVDNDDDGLARPRPSMRDWNEGDMHGAFFDFDNDGWKDIVVASSDYENTHAWLWRQTTAGQFEEVSDETGLNHPWPAGLAVADFDLDGDLDFVTGSSNARSGTPWTTREVHLYENTRDPGNWVRLTGLPAGTRVEVDAGGLTQVQEVSGTYGHYGILNDVALHFGLGEACAVDEVRATRPGGAAKSWSDVQGNQPVALTW